MTISWFKRKFELDSLLRLLRHGRLLFKATQDPQPFEDRWCRAAK